MSAAKPRRKRRKKYRVYLDSNCLFVTKDKDRSVVNFQSEKLLQDLLQLADIELLIPGVVEEELVFQALQRALSYAENARTAFKAVSLITDLESPEPPSEEALLSAIREKVKKWREALGIKVIAVPHEKIDWLGLISRAVERKPPFDKRDPENPENEKGFRDALIAESILHSEMPGDAEHIFVCKDQRLCEFATSDERNGGRLRIVKTLTELISEIRLRDEKVDAHAADEMVEEAPTAFARLWVKDLLLFDLKKTFAEEFAAPDGYSEAGKEHFFFKKTEFLDLQKDAHRWKTTIEFTQNFLNPERPLSSALRLIARRLEFEVTWTAAIGTESRFENTEVIHTELIGSKIYNPLYEELRRSWSGSAQPHFSREQLLKLSSLSPKVASAIDARWGAFMNTASPTLDSALINASPWERSHLGRSPVPPPEDD